MNKTMHTEGPWSLGEIEDGWIEIDAKNAPSRHIGFARVVWRMEDDDRSPGCEANARLIAAAPELLDALLQLSTMYMRATRLPIPAQCRRAISKATGADQ